MTSPSPSPSTSPTPSPSPGLDSFERDLLTELRSVVTERAAAAAPRTAPPSRRRRPLQAASAVGALVAAAGAAVLAGGSPAFAVDTTDDGSVVVTINELDDADGLEEALADHGVRAEVDYAGDGPGTRVDGEGWVSVGTDGLPTDPGATPVDPLPMDMTWLGTDGELPADPAAACGIGATGTAPITLERDGDGYVVTLAGPTLDQDNALRLSTVTSPDGDSLLATYAYGGYTCGAAVSR